MSSAALSYVEGGNNDGPLVIFLHGVSNSSLWWARLAGEVAAEYHTVAIDALGHGQSPRFSAAQLGDPFEASVEAAARTVRALTRAAGKPAVLVGHSMGGAIATRLSQLLPESVKALLLADPAWLSPELEAFYKQGAIDAVERTSRWAADPAGAIIENRQKRPSWTAQEHLNWAYGQANVDINLIKTGIVSFSRPWLDVIMNVTHPTTVLTSDGEDCIVGGVGKQQIEQLGKPNIKVLAPHGGTHSIVPEFFDTFVSELRALVEA